MLFSPSDLQTVREHLTFENYKLTEEELLDYGRRVTEIRKGLRTKAMECIGTVREEDIEIEQQSVLKLAKRVHRGYLENQSLSILIKIG